MRFREWVLGSKQQREPPDPDEPVELVVVRAMNGPMTVARLRADGFDAAGYEFAGWKGFGGSYRILVPRRELRDASALLEQIL